jgi:hypothetical protein
VIYVWTTRLGGPGRGRADPITGRALRRLARHPEPLVHAPGLTPTRRRPPGRSRWSA